MIKMRGDVEPLGGSPADGRPATCEEFQARMPQLIGGSIRDHEHLKTCARCAALLEELEYIASIAGDLLLPVHEPRDSVWDKIQASLPHPGSEPQNSNGNSAGPPPKS